MAMNGGASTVPRTNWGGRSPAQWFCLLGGAILVLRGALGVAFNPEFESPGEGWHQLIHFSSGVLLLAASARPRTALALALGFGVFYALVALVGFIDGGDVAGVIPIQNGDNVLHTVLTTASLGAAAVSARRGPSPVRTT